MTAAGDRRRLLLDAALEVAAAGGLRALTHRAVEARAGLSPGSASYYFRTRLALLDALAQHISRLDAEDLVALDPGRVEGPAATARERLLEVMTDLLERWAGAGRARTLVRYQLLLDRAAREGADTGGGWKARFAERAATALGLDLAQCRLLATALDGLLLETTLQARPADRTEIRSRLDRLLGGLLPGP
ncbi:MAG TPA: TetR family transcriptional regulator [Candidatus Dormibacteraeota bacterium]|nr:TetR family transcriptional regulator [Candidatus Dormibacteraeota bacterium]